MKFSAYSSAPSVGTSSSRRVYSLDAVSDPVDSASGQFYETETDLDLGGPMSLVFSRFYSSQLAKSGVASALGTNWMSGYDSAISVSGTTAKVCCSAGWS